MLFNKFEFLPDLKGTGDYLAFIVVIPLANESVQQMLPEALELAPQNLTPAGEHPVTLMFGHQMNVHAEHLKIFDLDYLEAAVSVSYVRWAEPGAGYRGPFLFSPRIFPNETLPILLGFFYGLAKQKASIGMDETHYIVDAHDSNDLLVSGDFVLKSDFAPASSYPLFKGIPSLMQQPIIGQTELGPFVCSQFDWNFDQAQIRAIEAEVHIAQAFTPGLPVGRFPRPSIETDPLGAFQLKTQWTLSRPMECAHIKSG